jgi:hypothetical protein
MKAKRSAAKAARSEAKITAEAPGGAGLGPAVPAAATPGDVVVASARGSVGRGTAASTCGMAEVISTRCGARSTTRWRGVAGAAVVGRRGAERLAPVATR